MLIGGGRERPARIEDLIDSALIARLDAIDLRSRKIFSGRLQGERRSKKRGQSVEFDDYRDYVPGDDLRFIDWNVYARLDRLFIKLFLEEEDLALHLALDASASMDAGSPNKLVFGTRVAMALAYIGLIKNNRVGMTIFGLPTAPADSEQGRSSALGLAHLSDRRGRRHLRAAGRFLLDTLWEPGGVSSRTSGIAPAPGAAFNDAIVTIARGRRGRGVMVVISDFLVEDGYERGLRALAAAGGYDTVCLQVLSPGEIDPQRESESGLNGDLRLTDVESGKHAEVTMTAALVRQYRKRLEGYCADLHSYCLSREMAHVLCRSDTPLETLILDTLRRRGVVG